MPGGRPPQGAKLARRTKGSVRAKKRLEMILQTLSGERTVDSATEVLGICPAAFYKLRNRTLQEAVDGLEPREVGRPAKERSESDERVAELEEENAQLRRQLKIMQTREEIALVLPGVGKRRRSRKKGL